MIEIKELTKKYGSVTALDGLTLSFSDGGVHGILGADGAGKSTLLDIVCGCFGASSGEVRVGDTDVLAERKSVLRRIGYMSEKSPCYEDMTVDEHLVFVGEAKRVPYDKLYKNIKSALELNGMLELSDRLISKLTDTQKRRLGIAAAMLGNPDVIVLDEPGARMSQEDAEDTLELIKKLGGVKTVLVASREPSVIEAVCDDVAVLSRGKLVVYDTLAGLKERLGRKKALRVTVKGSEEDVIAKLSGLGVINDCTVLSSGGGALTLKVGYSGEEDIREKVFSLFAEEGMPILSMDSETIGLEDLYIKLRENEENEDKTGGGKK